MINLVLDTDIGDDIDDAFALLYAIKSSEVNLKAVTTVIDNTEARARIAKRLLHDFGQSEVPVFAGESTPLSSASRQTRHAPPQYLAKLMDNMSISGSDGVASLADLITAEDDVEILAIGPLTNIARLIERFPETLARIKCLHIMGGCYYRHMNEWNIERDPEAAKLVFESGIPLNLIGLDVTTQCCLKPEQVDFIRNSGSRNVVITTMMDLWMEKVDRDGVANPILHDPLALHSLLSNNDVTFQEEHVSIETKGEVTRGFTYTEPYRLWGGVVPKSHIHVAHNVSVKRFLSAFFNTCFHDQ
ncbi:nucleoside hydrolase [Vibrio mediterranei]